MTKLLLLTTLAVLSPLVARANDVHPKYGHYVGTAIDYHHVVHRKISFDLKKDGHVNRPAHLHIASADFTGAIYFAYPNHHHFKFKVLERLGLTEFNGHGKWEASNKVAGDFREHARFTPDVNTYYTWHAHWVHD